MSSVNSTCKYCIIIQHKTAVNYVIQKNYSINFILVLFQLYSTYGSHNTHITHTTAYSTHTMVHIYIHTTEGILIINVSMYTN